MFAFHNYSRISLNRTSREWIDMFDLTGVLFTERDKWRCSTMSFILLNWMFIFMCDTWRMAGLKAALKQLDQHPLPTKGCKAVTSYFWKKWNVKYTNWYNKILKQHYTRHKFCRVLLLKHQEVLMFQLVLTKTRKCQCASAQR